MRHVNHLRNYSILTLILFSGVQAQSSDVEQRVEDLLSRMTLEEKVGQMTQLTLQAISKTRKWSDSPYEVDPEKLKEAIVDRHVGSILNVWDAALTLDEWHTLIGGLQDTATRQTRLKIPIIYGIDAVHGHNYLAEGTLFPQNLGLAATWDLDHVRRAAEVTATEVRACGIHWNFAPVLDVARQPLWSRFFETFGEDVLLVTRMGEEAIRGLEQSSPFPVAACAKHYVGYGFPLSGKDRTPAWIPERMLREIFLPPFRSAFEAGVKTLMVNSGELNGIPVHASYEILTELARNELGFDGVMVTDWEDILKLQNIHRVARTEKEAVAQAIGAGIDMSMVPYRFTFQDKLIELVKEGRIAESRINQSVRRILRLKFEIGLFDNAYPDPEMRSKVATPEARQDSLEAARDSIVLLKNQGGRLPLSKDLRILVTGPTATSLPALHGSWTYSWQGTETGLYPQDTPDLLRALRSRISAANVIHVAGSSFDEAIDIEDAVRAARDADVVLVCLGDFPVVEKPGDIEDLMFDEAQLQLAEAIEATGKPWILVLLENRPRIIRTIAEKADAILLANYPGMFGGQALAEVIFGDTNPNGRLPFTYPRYSGSLVPYDHKNSDRVDIQSRFEAFNPQFEFGFGLSYTTFKYTGLTLDSQKISPTGRLNVAVSVTNTGDRAGKEAVQLYVSDLYATVTPAVRRLRAFEKVSLAAGETKTVRFSLGPDELSFIGRDHRPVVEPGEFRILVGPLSGTFHVQ